MKKFTIAICVLALVFTGLACTQSDQTPEKLGMSKIKVMEEVQGWSVFTNPAYRYELRHPKNWKLFTSGEDGVSVALYPQQREVEIRKNKETFYGSLIIVSHSNWQEKYTLEEFYRDQTENLFLGNYDQQPVALGEAGGIWFKDVRNKKLDNPEDLVDVIVLDLEDRIIEIEVHDKQYWDTIQVILNSIKFYPGKVNSNL
jgi:hypothetical protein